MRLSTLTLLLPLSAHAADWHESPYDDIAHVAGGLVVGCAVSRASGEPLYGVLAALAVGTIKEATDKNFDGKDLAGWGVGGVVGVVCLQF
jgi:hypothetical protein